MRHKDLESLRVCISHHESHLRQDLSEANTPDDDDLFGQGAEAEMATAPGADDAPSESAMTQASDPPPTEGQTHAMEVDEEGVVSPPASPVSHADDELLTGGDAIGVEADLAHLMVSSPRGPNGEGEEASVSEALPRWSHCDSEAFSMTASKEETKLLGWMKRDELNQKTGSQLPVKTPERPFLEAYVVKLFHIVVNLFHYVVRLNQMSN